MLRYLRPGSRLVPAARACAAQTQPGCAAAPLLTASAAVAATAPVARLAAARRSHTKPPDFFDFYEKTVGRYSSKPITRVPVKEFFDMAKNPTEEALVKNARFLHKELPIRLAIRVKDFHRLPYIIACNPYLRELYGLYFDAFARLRDFPEIKDMDDVRRYTKELEQHVDDHHNAVELLGKGVRESRRFGTSKAKLIGFLERTIESRIAIRLLIEHHVAITTRRSEEFAGIVHKNLRAADLLRKLEQDLSRMCIMRYQRAPKIVIAGPPQTTAFAYVPPHLEYIFQELLKNAMRATAEFNRDAAELPDIVVTVCRTAFGLIFRFSDQGGGIRPELEHKVWEWSYTTSDDADPSQNMYTYGIGTLMAEEEREGPLAGLGFGLPLSRMYARYFGGSLDLMSMFEYGTDVYLRLQHLDSLETHLHI